MGEHMRIGLSVLFAALAWLLGVNGAAFGFGIGIQPTTVEIELEPGEQRRQVITLGNVHQERTISLTIGLADWALTEDGQISLTAPGEKERSGAEWVRFSPAFVTLEPGQSQQIVVDMAAPIRLPSAGDHRFALLASTILPDERNAGSGVWRRYQLASLFYLTVGDAESLPEITSTGLVTNDVGETLVGVRVENPGNAHARLNGAVEIETRSGETVSEPIGNLVVLDQSARNYQVPLAVPLDDTLSISVKLENTFAPQFANQFEALEPAVVALPGPGGTGAGAPLPE
ncbi:MAG: hypothetical protein AAF753_02240 [Pseudomonadota bacterium]